MDMSLAGNRFRTRFTAQTGQKFYGQMLDIPDTTRVGNFDPARRLIRVSNKSTTIIQPGMTFLTPEGQRFLAADHGYSADKHRYLKCYLVDVSLQWKRRTRVENTLTGIEEFTAYADLGEVYCALEPKTSLEDTSGFPAARKILVTNVALMVDDVLTNYVVTKVDFQNGVTLAEVKDD